MTHDGIAFYKYDLEMPNMNIEQLKKMADASDQDLRADYMRTREAFVNPFAKEGEDPRMPQKQLKGWRKPRKRK